MRQLHTSHCGKYSSARTVRVPHNIPKILPISCSFMMEVLWWCVVLSVSMTQRSSNA